MRFLFKNDDLRKLYTDGIGGKNYSQEVVKAFFRVMGVIKNAADERDLRQLGSLHYEQLKGKRQHQHSLRLNRQWRLIVERQQDAEGRLLWVIDIEDYHGLSLDSSGKQQRVATGEQTVYINLE